MAVPELGAEQVGFVCPPREGGGARMEMMAGEFCGNATRAFGMMAARRTGCPRVRVETSGCAHPVTVDCDLTAGTARAEMPLPRWVKRCSVSGQDGTLVHLGGIVHLVVENAAPRKDFFLQAEPVLQAIPGLDAYGVIFLNGTRHLTPLVKVPATGTLVWEGSCGSGSLAAALAQGTGSPDGTFERDYVQPAGTVRATVIWKGGKASAAYIGGPVTLGKPVRVEL